MIIKSSCKAKITYLYITIFIDQNITWFLMNNVRNGGEIKLNIPNLYEEHLKNECISNLLEFDKQSIEYVLWIALVLTL